MKALQYPLAIACLAALLLVLTTALPTPTAHATASVPVGLSPAEWTQIQSQLPAYAITTWSQQAKLTASDAAAEDRFGNSVAVAGDTALIGAYGTDDGGSFSGSVYVFTRTGGVWTQQAELTASDAAADQWFGAAVAMTDDTAVIGASFGNSAYVFTRTGGVWSQQAKLVPSDGVVGDNFGVAVAIGGDRVIVGANQDDDNGFNSGSAYVFTRTAGAWSEQTKLIASDGVMLANFGQSVGLAGDTAVIGAYGDASGGTNSGSAYIFTHSGGVWTQQAKLMPSDGVLGDRFGYAVAIAGDTVVSGAFRSHAPASDSGSAYVFTRTAGVWSQQAKLVASDGADNHQFGIGVALVGDTAIIGANGDSPGGLGSGSAYIFTRSGTTWTQQAKLVASDVEPLDQLGTALALTGDTAVAGVPFNDDAGNSSGSAYVFRICIASANSGLWSNPATWLGGVVPSNPASACIETGHTVTLDGNTAVNNLRINQGGTLDLASHTLSAEGNVINDGTLRQSRVVNNGAVHFLHIQNAAQTVTQYRGVWLDASLNGGNNLGNTTVTVRELNSGQYCTNTAASSPAYARRCFDITPTNQPATGVMVRLYGRTADELNGIDEMWLTVYRNLPAGSGTWVEQFTNASSGNDGGAYSFGQGEVTGFSPFLLGEVDVIPTAVALSALATHQPAPFLMIGTALLLLWLTSLRWLARPR